MRSVPRLFLAVLLAAFFVAPTLAEATPEAAEWLSKLAGLYEKGPYRMNYDMAMTTTQMGQTMNLEATGSVTQHGPRQMRLDMNVTMKGMAGMQQPGMPAEMKMTSLMVADGNTMWTQMEMPMVPGTRVMKMDLDMAEKGGLMGAQTMSMDPMSQLQKAAKIFDFDVTDSAAGTVTLTAPISEEGMEQFMRGAPPGVLGDTDGMRIEIILDRKDALPVEMRFGGETPIMVVHFSDFEFISVDELPEGIFSYSPPDDAHVMDVNQMLGAGGGG